VDQYEPLVTHTYVCFATTALYQAEKALRESSGDNAPVQCWGCEGPHLWRDCPKKLDEECHKRFTENLAKYTEHHRNRANRFDPAQYKQDGFPSKVASSYFNQLMDPALDGDHRKSILQLFLAECATSKGYFTRGSQLKNDQDDEEVLQATDTTPYTSFMTYQSIEEPPLNQWDDATESDLTAPVEFVVPAMSSVLVTPSGSVVATRPLVPAPPIVHHTTWGQPYGTHYTNGTDDELLKYFIDLQTGYPIDPYTGKIIDFSSIMPRRVIDAVRCNMGMFDGSLPPPYISSALMDFMRIEEGSLSSFADSQSCLNGAQYKAWFTGYADCFNPSSKHNWDVPKTSFTCWFGGIQTVELPDEDSDSMWNVSPTPKIFLSNANMP
jgi:hypothetical protein